MEKRIWLEGVVKVHKLAGGLGGGDTCSPDCFYGAREDAPGCHKTQSHKCTHKYTRDGNSYSPERIGWYINS